jgi:hypothetical protein
VSVSLGTAKPMFPKTHTIFVPKAEVADPVPLQKKAAEFAQKCGLNPWEQWFGLRGNEWAYVFAARGNAAWLFRHYCATKQITARAQW